jgi:hypothetical protein
MYDVPSRRSTYRYCRKCPHSSKFGHPLLIYSVLLLALDWWSAHRSRVGPSNGWAPIPLATSDDIYINISTRSCWWATTAKDYIYLSWISVFIVSFSLLIHIISGRVLNDILMQRMVGHPQRFTYSWIVACCDLYCPLMVCERWPRTYS